MLFDRRPFVRHASKGCWPNRNTNIPTTSSQEKKQQGRITTTTSFSSTTRSPSTTSSGLKLFYEPKSRSMVVKVPKVDISQYSVYFFQYCMMRVLYSNFA